MKFIFIIVLLMITVLLVTFNIAINEDSYDILLKNRFTGLGFGVNYKDGFEIWHFAHTVHGGLAENRLYPKINTNL